MEDLQTGKGTVEAEGHITRTTWSNNIFIKNRTFLRTSDRCWVTDSELVPPRGGVHLQGDLDAPLRLAYAPAAEESRLSENC